MRQLVLTLFLTSSTFLKLYGQSVPCPFVNAGPDQTADCSSAQGCANLTATFLDIRETSSYSIESIPHTLPIPYNQSGGTQVSANTDDVWSSIITLPFSFCYYGQTYTTCKIGSNGSILFNPTAGAGGQPWAFSASLTNTTGINGAGHVLGVYHDIDPSVCGTIKWFVSGSAPCRQFIVSYDQICQFSCTTIKSRHMMVLNETTNYIDVYVESKPLCAGWNGGNAVIGLQNFAQNGGITAPNRNTAPDWTVTTPEGWRFKPAGTPLYSLEWFEGTTSLGTTPTISVCPTTQTTYTAQFTYTKCGSTTPTVLTDDVAITPAPGQINAVASPQQSTCGQPNGSVSITASGGSGTLTFSSDNVTYGSNNTFSGLTSGTYTFYVQDQGGCTVSLPIQITDLSTLTASIISDSDVSCFGGNNGEIQVNASFGNPPYSYSINSQAAQTSGLFTNLSAGIYTISVSDAQSCNFTIIDTLFEPSQLVISEINNDSTTCNLSNGAIEVTAAGGFPSYSFSINQIPTNQTSGLFNSLDPGNYSIYVTDQNGCIDSINSTIYANPSIDLSIVAVNNVSCVDSADGIASVFAGGGPSPYIYYLANGSPQDFSVFSNLSPGTYTIFGSDANGCVDSVDVTILEPSPLISQVDPTAEVCVGNSVDLFASASGGTAPYTYNWLGLTGNPATVSPTASSTYQVVVTDANGCTDTNEVNTIILPLPIAMVTFNPNTGGAPLPVVFTNESQNATTYLWNFGDGNTGSTNSLTSVTNTYLEAGTYYIELTASNGYCEDVWVDSIVVIPVLPVEIEVPNVFTPNEDGNNEGYFVWTKNAASIEAVIVNRWGNTMVIIDDLNYKWDGKTPSGNDASAGVYFLKYKVIGLDGKEISGHTFFHLIR
ncbi:MAG: PKD domain-containing protein [Crocinitomicaceae bacterium]